ncbi:hypothetical protein BC828DRAFT_399942 [Blastocladiella britannica]|nr:hypothetical protein BC828DRAFT_399942 [Blastocladiella britannica]
MAAYLNLTDTLSFRAASRTLARLTPVLLKVRPDTRTVMVMAIVGGHPAVADAIFRSPDTSDQCVGDVVYHLVCRPHRNRRPTLRVRKLPAGVRELVFRPDHGLPDAEIAALVHDVFKVSPSLALHLVGVLGLTHQDWMQGNVSDASDAGDCYMQDDDEFDPRAKTRHAVARAFLNRVVPNSDTHPRRWVRPALFFSGGHDDDAVLAALDSLLDEIKVDELLLAVTTTPLSPEQVTKFPGALLALTKFLSRACTQPDMNIKPAWAVVEMIAAIKPAFMHDLMHSGLLKSIVTLDINRSTSTNQIGEVGNLGNAIKVVGDLYFAMSTSTGLVADRVFKDLGAAVIAIGRNIERIAFEGRLS